MTAASRPYNCRRRPAIVIVIVYRTREREYATMNVVSSTAGYMFGLLLLQTLFPDVYREPLKASAALLTAFAVAALYAYWVRHARRRLATDKENFYTPDGGSDEDDGDDHNTIDTSDRGTDCNEENGLRKRKQ